MIRIIEIAIVACCAAPFFFLLYQRARAVRAARRFDGVLLNSGAGEVFEVVDPAWWRVDRWLLWRRADGRTEFVVPDGMGVPRLHVFRMRRMKKTGDRCPLCGRARIRK